MFNHMFGLCGPKKHVLNHFVWSDESSFELGEVDKFELHEMQKETTTHVSISSSSRRFLSLTTGQNHK